LTPKALVSGNPKLNLAFVANLFNNHPCLEPLGEEEKAELGEFDDSDDREARGNDLMVLRIVIIYKLIGYIIIFFTVFTLWLNSLDVTPAVNNLYEDVKVLYLKLLNCLMYYLY